MKEFKQLSLVLLISTSILISLIRPVMAISNVNWILLKDNKIGKEWLDLGSIKKLKNQELSVLTRFYKKPSKSKEKGETTLYVMKINCENKYFKDISINGIPNFRSKWTSPNDDELIAIVIERSCSEIGL